MKTKDIPLGKIRLDGGTQQRAKIDTEHVAELAEALTEGATLPPARVYHDGTDYWLARGFHRFHAHKKATFGAMPCEVIQGTQRDAVLDACGDNADHGLKRTNADKRKAVETLLRDEEWGGKSDNWIAEAAKVDHKTVARVRDELAEAGQVGKSQPREGRDGKKYPAAKPVQVGKSPTESPKNNGKPSGGVTFDPTEWDDPPAEEPAAEVEPRTAEDFYEGEPVAGPWVCPTPKEAAKPFDLVLRLLKEWEETVVENIINSEEPGTAFIDGRAESDFRVRVNNLRDMFKVWRPHSVCPKCKGERCGDCRNSGLVPRRIAERLSMGVAS